IFFQSEYGIRDLHVTGVQTCALPSFLFMLTVFGQPWIEVRDANFLNRGELVLHHRYEGVPLKLDFALETLENVQALWKRPVHLDTYVDDEPVLLSYDGVEHTTEPRTED